MMPVEQYRHLPYFLRFLEEKAPCRVINRDQWMSFLEFQNTVPLDLTGYDESSACNYSISIIIIIFLFFSDYFVLSFSSSIRHPILFLGPVLFDEYVAWRRNNPDIKMNE